MSLSQEKRIWLEQPRREERRRGSRRSVLRKEGALSLRGYNSLLFDVAEYYLRPFRAVVAVVAGCWLVVRDICTGGLSEDGCDVRPNAAKRTLGVVTCRFTRSITSGSHVMTGHINAPLRVRVYMHVFISPPLAHMC